MAETLHRERGRLETLRRLTGGNPRLLVLACRLLIESPLGSAFEDLERLIDEQTPLLQSPESRNYRFRPASCSIVSRRDGSRCWQREVADAAKLTSSHASAQLKQLVEKGYSREIRLPGAKRTRYEVSDRFYNIYYLLRFSRAGPRPPGAARHLPARSFRSVRDADDVSGSADGVTSGRSAHRRSVRLARRSCPATWLEIWTSKGGRTGDVKRWTLPRTASVRTRLLSGKFRRCLQAKTERC